MQISIGLPDPREQSSLPVLKRVQAGISHTRVSAGQLKRVRLRITPQLLRQIKSALDSSADPQKLVLWAVCCTAFFGFFRLGELLPGEGVTFNLQLHLAWGDVAVDDLQDPKMVRVHLKQSKTDQMGQGANIILGGQAQTYAQSPRSWACGKPGCATWRILSGRKEGTPSEVHICRQVSEDPGDPWFSPAPIRQPQFQDWGGNHGRSGRSGGLDDPAPRTVAECCILAVRQDPAGQAGGTILYTGRTRMPAVTCGPLPKLERQGFWGGYWIVLCGNLQMSVILSI